jgi:hypothetical protein
MLRSTKAPHADEQKERTTIADAEIDPPSTATQTGDGTLRTPMQKSLTMATCLRLFEA